MTTTITTAAEPDVLPERGRNGERAVFTYRHQDGREAPVRMRRVIGKGRNGWEVEPDDWWVFDGGWQLAPAQPTPAPHETDAVRQARWLAGLHDEQTIRDGEDGSDYGEGWHAALDRVAEVLDKVEDRRARQIADAVIAGVQAGELAARAGEPDGDDLLDTVIADLETVADDSAGREARDAAFERVADAIRGSSAIRDREIVNRTAIALVGDGGSILGIAIPDRVRRLVADLAAARAGEVAEVDREALGSLVEWHIRTALARGYAKGKGDPLPDGLIDHQIEAARTEITALLAAQRDAPMPMVPTYCPVHGDLLGLLHRKVVGCAEVPYRHGRLAVPGVTAEQRDKAQWTPSVVALAEAAGAGNGEVVDAVLHALGIPLSDANGHVPAATLAEQWADELWGISWPHGEVNPSPERIARIDANRYRHDGVTLVRRDTPHSPWVEAEHA